MHGLNAHPTIEDQERRFASAGFLASTVWDMNQVYYKYLPRSLVAKIERLEMFDELEEWHMMQAHYCMAVACKGGVDCELVPDLGSRVGGGGGGAGAHSVGAAGASAAGAGAAGAGAGAAGAGAAGAGAGAAGAGAAGAGAAGAGAASGSETGTPCACTGSAVAASSSTGSGGVGSGGSAGVEACTVGSAMCAGGGTEDSTTAGETDSTAALSTPMPLSRFVLLKAADKPT